MQAQLRFEGCPGTLIASMSELSRQEDLARFYANPEGTKESSVPHRNHTEVKNGSQNRKRTD
jgi:hypothetical protein